MYGFIVIYICMYVHIHIYYMYVCTISNNWCITVVAIAMYTALLPLIKQLTLAREASTEMITNCIHGNA